MQISKIKAVQLLRQGGVVALPTETVYGLSASIKHSEAIQKIFKLKGRPSQNPLIVHVANYLQAKKLVKNVSPYFIKLQKIWPAPLTVVEIANTSLVPLIIRGGLNTVAIRIPQHKIFLDILKKTGPLAAPSANLSGKPSPTKPQHVENDFQNQIPVVYGGHCKNGVESTVIQFNKNSFTVLRLGAWSGQKISRLLNLPEKLATINSKKSPGTRLKHYAPQAKLILCLKYSQKQAKIEAVLGFDDTFVEPHVKLLSLGLRNNHKINLACLYHQLRQIDKLHFKFVAVDIQFKTDGLGATLLDRIERAAQKKGGKKRPPL